MALMLMGGLAACSGEGTDAGAGDSSRPAVAESEAQAGEADRNGLTGTSQGRNGVNRTTVRAESVVRTGQVAITGRDLDDIRDRIDRLLLDLDGTIDEEQTSHDDNGDVERSTLVLRVPVADFGEAMDALEQLGTRQSSDRDSTNVTQEVIDVEERVETLQNSLDRLQDYQLEAEDIDDLIRFEEQITTRESELRSLEAQQAHLLDQAAMSTITVHLSTPENYVSPKSLDDAGFLAGLRDGWNALADVVLVGLTVLGAVLPFGLASALVVVPVWLLVRQLARRRTPATARPDGPASTDASAPD